MTYYFQLVTFLMICCLSVVSLARDNEEQVEDFSPHVIKVLKNAGKIISLEQILQHLNPYGITRLLEVELVENKDHPNNSEYLYQIEYIDHQGMVLELEVDALTSQVLHLDKDGHTSHHKDDD